MNGRLRLTDEVYQYLGGADYRCTLVFGEVNPSISATGKGVSFEAARARALTDLQRVVTEEGRYHGNPSPLDTGPGDPNPPPWTDGPPNQQ